MKLYLPSSADSRYDIHHPPVGSVDAFVLRKQLSLRGILFALLVVNIGSCVAHYIVHAPEKPQPITAATSGYRVAE